ncbi:MAG: hypothetical protein NTX87_03875 [Planctomycetota bacterium]|nr:hypothetical protein [Planctomycetota bacterium]
MKWGIVVGLGLAVAVAGWGLAGAVETKSQNRLGGQEPPTAAPAGQPGGTVVKETAAKAADAAAERKAREEAARKAQELARTRRTLTTGKTSVNFENAAVKDVLAYMAEVGKFSVVFDGALQEAGIDLSARTVTIRFTGMTYEDAVNLVLPKECGYRIEPGFILVTTLEKSWIPLKTATYSIQLALAEVPDFEGPRFDVSTVLSQTRQGGGGGGIFANTKPQEEKGKATPERIIDMIKKFVRNQTDRRIAPWDDEGGPATIQYLGGRLIVSQTDQGHRAVAKLLASLE